MNNTFENTYLRGELITIEGKTYKTRTSFIYNDTNYLLVDDNKFSLLSLVDLGSSKAVISNYVSAKDIIIELSGNDKAEEKVIGKAIADGRRQADNLKASIKAYGDPRTFAQVEEVIQPKPLEVGELVYVNIDAPYCHSNTVTIGGWGYTIDSHFRVGLLKYLLVKSKFNLYSLLGFTGKKTKELTLLLEGQLTIEETMKALSCLVDVPVSEIRMSRMSGIEQSKQAAKQANKKYKL